MRVAALEDNPVHLELTERVLVEMGHDCHGYLDSRSLLRALRRETFDLLVLDWQLPDVSGLEVLRWARDNLQERIPALMITHRSTEADLIEGLAAGADDFLVKPIRVGELAARVKALLRRAYHQQTPPEFEYGRYRFDIAGAQISVDGAPVALKQKEFDLALFLFRNSGRLLSRKHLLEAVWGIDAAVSSRSLDTHVSRLRTKLGLTAENGYRLAAVYSVGYRLETIGAERLRHEAGAKNGSSSSGAADRFEDEVPATGEPGGPPPA